MKEVLERLRDHKKNDGNECDTGIWVPIIMIVISSFDADIFMGTA